MRVAIVVHKFPPTSLGGTEVYAHTLARALSKRHKVFVFHRENLSNQRQVHEVVEERDAVKIWRVGLPILHPTTSPMRAFLDTFFSLEVEDSFKRFLEFSKPDVVHFQHLMSLSYRLPLFLRGRSASLLTFHDYWFTCANAQLIRPNARVCTGKNLGLSCAECATHRIGRRYLQLVYPAIALAIKLRDRLVWKALSAFERFISPSHFLKSLYVGAGLPDSLIEVLENGINLEALTRFKRVPPEDSALRITYIGAIAWQKGVHVLVEAVRGLDPRRFRVRIYGDPSAFPEYAEHLRSIMDERITEMKGRIPNDRAGWVLARSDVLAFPSLWLENSPVVIQEAHALGVPILASNVGAVPEKVGRGGTLVPPGDVEAWREAIIRWPNGRNFVPEPVMSIDEHVSRLEQIYASL